MRRKSTIILIIAIPIWLTALAVGLISLEQYAHEPGAVGADVRAWPGAASFARAPEKHHMVFFAHPKCPCTRASLAELDRVMTRVHADVALTIVLYRPDDEPDDWTHTDLHALAGRIPGATIVVDPGARLAEAFGARTSGHAVLYDESGTVCFSGGLTSARGHEGASAGTDAILHHMRTRESTRLQAPVFGCALTGCPESTGTSDDQQACVTESEGGAP